MAKTDAELTREYRKRRRDQTKQYEREISGDRLQHPVARGLARSGNIWNILFVLPAEFLDLWSDAAINAACNVNGISGRTQCASIMTASQKWVERNPGVFVPRIEQDSAL